MTKKEPDPLQEETLKILLIEIIKMGYNLNSIK
jgi:hypothetical protein